MSRTAPGEAAATIPSRCLAAKATPDEGNETRIFTCLRSSITLGAHLEQRKLIERVKGPQFSEPP
jgi:hypothetical protein